MDHYKEAERLLEKSKNGTTSGQLSDAEDAALRLAWATQAQVHATLANVVPLSSRTKLVTQYGVKEVKGGEPVKVSVQTGYGYSSEEGALQDAYQRNKAADEGTEYIPVQRRALTTYTMWEVIQ